MRLTVFLLALVALAAPPLAAAQPAVVVVVDGSSPSAARRWRRRLAEALPAGQIGLAEWARAREPIGTVTPDRLVAVSEIEELLLRARYAAARLRERDALVFLSLAESRAEQNLDVPGVAAWYAEVQLAIAIVAAQSEARGLSEAALLRAASVDPRREVRAAEARPEVVELGREAARAAATRPRGRFEVRADARGAVVAIDDRPMGRLPRRLEVPVGPHVLRIDAPGHQSWARVVTVFEGDRPPVDVVLAPTPLLSLALRLEAVAAAGRVDEVQAQIGALLDVDAEPPTLWLLYAGSTEHDRAVVVGCDRAGCGGPQRLRGDEPVRLELDGTLTGLSTALAWLTSDGPDVPPTTDPPWFERWELWVGVGLALAAGATAIGVGAQPQGPPPLVLEVDTSGLPLP